MKYVGKNVNRTDAKDKISGKARYINDFSFPGMLYGLTVRSQRQRAKITKIKLPLLPRSIISFSFNEIPGKNYVNLFNQDQPFLAENYVQYIGEPILLLAGPDIQKLKEIEAQIEIEYQDIPPINSIKDAFNRQLPPIFGKNNIIKTYKYHKGNPDDFFGASGNKHKIIEGKYKTGYQEHAYLETQGMIAIPKKKGIKIIGSMQCPFYINKALSIALALNPENIEVEHVTTGGAFGGKEEFPSLLAGHVAFLAIKSGKPVKMIYDRHEDVCVTTKRHPSETSHKIAFDSDNRICALDMTLLLDSGAHSTLSQIVLARAALAATGVYKCNNSKLLSQALTTNNIPSGAFRGFGAPQAFFALEQQINHSAYKLDIDPYTLRKLNILRKGDKTATGQPLDSSIGMEKVLDLVAKNTNFVEKYQKYQTQKNQNGTRKGIGMSAFFHGCGFTGKGEEIIRATASVEYSKQKGAVINIATVEMGQGMNTIMKQIAAESLEIPIQNVSLTRPNTCKVPNSGPTVASRTTVIVGGLIQQCCLEIKKQIQPEMDPEKILTVSKTYSIPEEIKYDEEKFTGHAYPVFSWVACVVEVTVDLLSFETKVDKITAAHDIGKAINPILVEGQIEGGTLQGLGYSSMEKMTVTKGKLNHQNLTDYIIPTSLDAPDMIPIIVEEEYKKGPFGAKGVGEQPLVGVPAAYVGAVENGLGMEFFEIPLTPEIIYREFRKRNLV